MFVCCLYTNNFQAGSVGGKIGSYFLKKALSSGEIVLNTTEDSLKNSKTNNNNKLGRRQNGGLVGK